jgi:hypothetical protein
MIDLPEKETTIAILRSQNAPADTGAMLFFVNPAQALQPLGRASFASLSGRILRLMVPNPPIP